MPHWIWQHPDWPRFRWDEAALLPELSGARLRQGRLLGAGRLFDAGLSLEAQSEILVADGLNTSAIEGERLDAAEIRSSVARHLGLPAAGLPARSRSVDGLVEMLLDATRKFDRPLSLPRLCRWQAALFPTGFSGLHRVRTGKLRGRAPMRVLSGPAGKPKVHFEAPPRSVLEPELSRFIAWFNSPPAGLDGLLRAGIAHLRFVTLHPFDDGNGRIARALTDMAICRDERQPLRLFSLSAQIMQEREEYYAILERTQRGGLDLTPWLHWFLRQISAACDSAEATIGRVLAKAKFWLRHQGTTFNERQRKVLNRLLDAGPGGFEGGMNTRKYASLTRTSRATAYRELADLVEKKCIVAIGAGRSSAYTIRGDE